MDGIERHVVHSVGIDIGSSTSHFAISRLVIQRRGSDLSAEFVVSERETLYRSPIWLTPYRSGGQLIDVDELRFRLEGAYAEAGMRPDAVDTGAVVITGEALKKENAEQIARMLAGWSGRFICISAGPNHEAILAAHGSGSVDASARANSTIVNIDVGGGTTKISVVDNGVITHVESVSVGARLLAFDKDLRIVRMEDPARVLLARLGVPAQVGGVLDRDVGQRVAALMADVLADIVTGRSGDSALRADLFVASDGNAMPSIDDVDEVVFSGGVSEFLGRRPPTGFGDLGAELAMALHHRMANRGLTSRMRAVDNGIRATVLGASQFTVQASGQTCFISDWGVLPVRGLEAIPIDCQPACTTEQIRSELRKHDLDAWLPNLAAVLSFPPVVDYKSLRRTAEEIVAVAAEGDTDSAQALPLFLIMRRDLAHSLGAIVKQELHWRGPVVVVDGIVVGDLDHIDLGSPLGASGSIPVTVTSLQFPSRQISDATAVAK